MVNETIPFPTQPVRGKIYFHEFGPQCQKCWGPLSQWVQWVPNYGPTRGDTYFLSFQGSFSKFILDLCLFLVTKLKWQPSPVLLPGKSHGQRSLVGNSPWGRKELDMTERLYFQLRSKHECIFLIEIKIQKTHNVFWLLLITPLQRLPCSQLVLFKPYNSVQTHTGTQWILSHGVQVGLVAVIVQVLITNAPRVKFIKKSQLQKTFPSNFHLTPELSFPINPVYVFSNLF